jgi:hypothetical protein
MRLVPLIIAGSIGYLVNTLVSLLVSAKILKLELDWRKAAAFTVIEVVFGAGSAFLYYQLHNVGLQLIEQLAVVVVSVCLWYNFINWAVATQVTLKRAIGYYLLTGALASIAIISVGIIFLAIFVRIFILTNYSMQPSLVYGSLLLINKQQHMPRNGQVIAYKINSKQTDIARVVAQPGSVGNVAGGHVLERGKLLTAAQYKLTSSEYYVTHDDPTSDGTTYPPAIVERSAIVGTNLNYPPQK